MIKQTEIDKINILEMQIGVNWFICSICEKPVQKEDSFSCGGKNLVCTRCMNKVSHIFKLNQQSLILRLHE